MRLTINETPWENPRFLIKGDLTKIDRQHTRSLLTYMTNLCSQFHLLLLSLGFRQEWQLKTI
jgi:hypothetical protein